MKIDNNAPFLFPVQSSQPPNYFYVINMIDESQYTIKRLQHGNWAAMRIEGKTKQKELYMPFGYILEIIFATRLCKRKKTQLIASNS